jgi:hypothetical protein
MTGRCTVLARVANPLAGLLEGAEETTLVTFTCDDEESAKAVAVHLFTVGTAIAVSVIRNKNAS